jgi:hypothetical protein
MPAKGICTGMAVVLALLPAWAQRRTSNWPNPPAGAEHTLTATAGKPDPDLQARAALQTKAQAQKDAERLRQLSEELQREVDATPAGTLSLGAVKKTEQIQKLAKRLHKELQGQ